MNFEEYLNETSALYKELFHRAVKVMGRIGKVIDTGTGEIELGQAGYKIPSEWWIALKNGVKLIFSPSERDNWIISPGFNTPPIRGIKSSEKAFEKIKELSRK